MSAIEIGSTVTLVGDDRIYTVVTLEGEFAGLVSEGYVPSPGSSHVEKVRRLYELTLAGASNADISATPIATVHDIHNF